MNRIVDVSEHNGNIDWAKVKASGIVGAIIRCGYGQDQTGQDDKKWLRNVSECERLGIPYGVYLYSYAKTTGAVHGEINHALRLLKGHSPAWPVYFDSEQRGTQGVAKANAKMQASEEKRSKEDHLSLRHPFFQKKQGCLRAN